MGALCCRGGGGEGDEPRSSSGGASRHRRRSHSKKTHHAENASHAVVAADYDTASALVAPASGRAAAGLHALAPPPSPRRASKLSSAAPAPHSALAAAQKPFLVASGGAGALPSPRGGATLSRSESGVDVFHDAQESFDERDASSLAAAPFAFARHALCVEPPRTGHVCAGGGEAVLEVITATSAAMTAAAAGEDGEGAEQGKSAEVQEIEALGKEFGQDFWAGKGSLAGRGLKTLQALRHLKDVDLSRFGGVPISQHLPVSGSQMMHANTFMPGRVPPATRLDAHLRAELPAALQADPLERFLVVLRAHIALLDAPAHSLRKPFNPVLGETSRILHFVEPNAPPIAGITEQVSHHPPITAFASWDASLNVSYTGWVDISPRFMGLAIRVPMVGQRTLRLTPAGGAATEHYIATIPAMEWHFIPSVRAEYSGTWRLWCEETGLAAEITHPTKSFMGLVGRPNRVDGRVLRTARMEPAAGAAADGSSSPRRRASAEHELLFTFDGEFDGAVWLRPAGASRAASTLAGRERGAPRLLWDARSASVLESSVPPPLSQSELEARPADAVWGAVFRAMGEGAWEAARAGKEAVEVAEREARKQRAARGERWVPTWFERDARSGGWKPRA